MSLFTRMRRWWLRHRRRRLEALTYGAFDRSASAELDRVIAELEDLDGHR